MTGIRTTTVIRTSTAGIAALGIGLTLGACASPAVKTAAPVARSAQSAAQATRAPASAPAAQPPASAPAAPGGQAVPVVHVAPATPPALSAVASTTPSATAAPIATAAPVASAAASALPPSVPGPSNSTIDALGSPPHFTTPDAAMRYLVAAYNLHDLKAEMHVTTPDSRAALENERQWVNTFSFHSCTVNPGGGDYSCQFDMVSKVKTTDQGTDSFGADVQQMGEITVLVAPAQRPGWYMYYNEGCGGG